MSDQHDFRALMLVARPSEGGHPHWHRPLDVVENVDPDVVARSEGFLWGAVAGDRHLVAWIVAPVASTTRGGAVQDEGGRVARRVHCGRWRCEQCRGDREATKGELAAES